MLAESSTRCHFKMWSLGLPWYWDVQCRQGQKSMKLSEQMQQEGVQPSSVIFVGVLNACASMAAIQEGRCVHQQIIQTGLESNVFVGITLVDMYAKCGSIEDAWRVFNNMPY